jgi:hypothetical protein
MNSSNNGFWSESDHIKDRRFAIPIDLEYLLDQAQDQNAGGGRINWVVAGRTIGEASETRIARDAVTKTGVDATVWALSPI